MKSQLLFVLVGIATVAATGTVEAASAYGRITFVGAVVRAGCDSSLPPLGMQGGVGSCGASGSARTVYMEQTGRAITGSGVAMLDYFVDRPGGGRKVLVTREYR